MGDLLAITPRWRRGAALILLALPLALAGCGNFSASAGATAPTEPLPVVFTDPAAFKGELAQVHQAVSTATRPPGAVTLALAQVSGDVTQLVQVTGAHPALKVFSTSRVSAELSVLHGDLLALASAVDAWSPNNTTLTAELTQLISDTAPTPPH